MKSVKYIGLDVHQATISIAVVDGNGKLVIQSVIATQASTILDFIHGLRGELHVTFEEGTAAQWLYLFRTGLSTHYLKLRLVDVSGLIANNRERSIPSSLM